GSQNLAGHHAEMEIKVTNNADQLNDDADAHNQTLSISSIKDQTVKLNKAQLNLYFAQSKEIGAKHACWNGIKGATLKPGESCYQIISVTGPNKSFIDGKIYVYAQSISGQKTHTTMDIKTGFYPSKKLM
ncbi:hypothetical protein, partial [Facilibium subflavum]|uniref:hypothetical protein n=1 Tax=Facilibium subflavum TaxID=2219058 RepID=UPI0013C37A09